MTGTRSAPVLRCSDLILGGRTALSGPIDFSLQPGEVFCVIAPEGTGRGELLRSALGLARPLAGETFVLGHSPLEKPLVVKRRTGYAPRRHGIPEWMHAEAAGALVGGLQPAWDDPLFGSLLDEFDIPGGVPVKLLSSTQRSGLSLSLALGHRPHLLVADDAYSHLPAGERVEQLAPLTRAAKEAGMAVLLSSDDPAGLGELLDRVGVLSPSVPDGPHGGNARFETHAVPVLQERFRRATLDFPAGLPTEFRLHGALGIELERHRISVTLQGNDEEVRSAVAGTGATSVRVERLTRATAVEEAIRGIWRDAARA